MPGVGLGDGRTVAVGQLQIQHRAGQVCGVDPGGACRRSLLGDGIAEGSELSHQHVPYDERVIDDEKRGHGQRGERLPPIIAHEAAAGSSAIEGARPMHSVNPQAAPLTRADVRALYDKPLFALLRRSFPAPCIAAPPRGWPRSGPVRSAPASRPAAMSRGLRLLPSIEPLRHGRRAREDARRRRSSRRGACCEGA